MHECVFLQTTPLKQLEFQSTIDLLPKERKTHFPTGDWNMSWGVNSMIGYMGIIIISALRVCSNFSHFFTSYLVYSETQELNLITNLLSSIPL